MLITINKTPVGDYEVISDTKGAKNFKDITQLGKFLIDELGYAVILAEELRKKLKSTKSAAHDLIDEIEELFKDED